jgi:hypothetical protein
VVFLWHETKLAVIVDLDGTGVEDAPAHQHEPPPTAVARPHNDSGRPPGGDRPRKSVG